MSRAITATEQKLKPALEDVLAKAQSASGEAAAAQLVQRDDVPLLLWVDPKTGIDDHGRGPNRDARRVANAKATHKPSTAAVQRWAEANQQTVVRMTGGKETDDNKPTDVNVKIGNVLHGIEVKTLLHAGNDKITVHPKSRRRKEAWARRNNGVLHTVVLDDRKAFGSKGDSGHRLYYRRGVGAFRLHTMTKVRSTGHLKELMTAK